MKTNQYTVVLFVVGVLCLAAGFIIGRGISTDQQQDQEQSVFPMNEQTHFLVGKYKYELSIANKAALDCKEESFQFLLSAGYDEERAQVEVIQKKWTPEQWQEYALINERLVDALEESATAADKYRQVLKQSGLDERNFNAQKLGYE